MMTTVERDIVDILNLLGSLSIPRLRRSRQHYGAERKHSVTEKQGCLMGDVQMSAICETDSKIEQSFIYDKLRVTRGANRKSRPH
jgi:hypothetical protein